MRCLRLLLTMLVVVSVGAGALNADDVALSPNVLKTAIGKSIPMLEQGAKGSSEARTCFTCHSQAVPILALAEVRRRGFAIDEEIFAGQVAHTAAHLNRGKQSFLDGKGQGGKVISAGYALWALEAGGRPPDETTAAVASFLLSYQKDEPHWKQPGRRPPTSGSDYTATYLALRGLAAYAADQQQADIETRRETVKKWLLADGERDTEDRVFRLLTLPYVDADEGTIEAAAAELIDNQQVSGGWSQNGDLTSDAYATATVVVALLRAGKVSTDHPAVRRGVQYLIDTQLDDGTWHVVTRAKGFQTYYESGFPHGQDQFISIAASGWATLALTLALPESSEAVIDQNSSSITSP